MLKKRSTASECQIQGASRGPGLWAWVERCSRRGNRFSRKGQACELSAAHSIQPPELRAFILGNNVGFIICKNGGGKTGLTCSESCTGWDHLSGLIESPGCRAGGNAQPSGPDKHTYIHTYLRIFNGLSEGRSSQREEAVGFVTGLSHGWNKVAIYRNTQTIFWLRPLSYHRAC